MPKDRGKTREERRRSRRQNYLDGMARYPYTHTPTASTTSEGEKGGVCSRCLPVLSHYKEMFQGLIHQGSELKKRRLMSPDREVHVDVKHQNEWLLNNVFDPLGNYLYCAACVCKMFGISGRRLARQRNVKRKLSSDPIVHMTKTAVEEKKLSQFVIMPNSIDEAFIKWWRSLDQSVTVQVRYPYQHHGNSRCVSNSAKVSVMEQFLAFVDANIQPNGRQAGSFGPIYRLFPPFKCL